MVIKVVVFGSFVKRIWEVNGKKGKEDELLSKKKKFEVVIFVVKLVLKVVFYVFGFVFLCLFDVVIFLLMFVWN